MKKCLPLSFLAKTMVFVSLLFGFSMVDGLKIAHPVEADENDDGIDEPLLEIPCCEYSQFFMFLKVVCSVNNCVFVESRR